MGKGGFLAWGPFFAGLLLSCAATTAAPDKPKPAGEDLAMRWKERVVFDVFELPVARAPSAPVELRLDPKNAELRERFFMNVPQRSEAPDAPDVDPGCGLLRSAGPTAVLDTSAWSRTAVRVMEMSHGPGDDCAMIMKERQNVEARAVLAPLVYGFLRPRESGDLRAASTTQRLAGLRAVRLVLVMPKAGEVVFSADDAERPTSAVGAFTVVDLPVTRGDAVSLRAWFTIADALSWMRHFAEGESATSDPATQRSTGSRELGELGDASVSVRIDVSWGVAEDAPTATAAVGRIASKFQRETETREFSP